MLQKCYFNRTCWVVIQEEEGRRRFRRRRRKKKIQRNRLKINIILGAITVISERVIQTQRPNAVPVRNFPSFVYFLLLSLFLKQPSRGVRIKRCSENMQQIYRITPISKCDLKSHFGIAVLGMLLEMIDQSSLFEHQVKLLLQA